MTIKQDNTRLNVERDFLLPLLMNGQVQVRPQGELNYDLAEKIRGVWRRASSFMMSAA